MKISLIAAMSKNRAIGKDNKLLWHLPEDLKFFKETTLGKPIIMGRKTFESVGRPLPKRRNIVVTRNPEWKFTGVEVAKNLQDAFDLVSHEPEVFVVGGSEIYAQAIPRADEILLTVIESEFEADTFFPEFEKSNQFRLSSRDAFTSENGLKYSINRWKRV